MAHFNNAITENGRLMLARAQSGAVLIPTRIVIGSGNLPAGQTPATMTAVVAPVKELTINKKQAMPDGKCIIGGVYNNADVSTAFYFRELAVFMRAEYRAEDGTVTQEVEEVLYSYGNAGSTADYMPAYSTSTVVEKQIDLVIWVGNEAQVDLTIETGVYLTQEQGVLNLKHINPETVGFASLLEYMASIYDRNIVVSGHISGFSDMPEGVSVLHGTINVVGGLLTVSGNARTTYYYRGTNSLTEWTDEWRKVFDTSNAPTPADVGAVNKAGDTMTGDLTIEKAIAALKLITANGAANFFKNANATNDLGTTISDVTKAGVTDRLILSAARTNVDKLRLVTSDGLTHYVLHTGNKDLIKPADIGAVSKAGDTMTGDLVIRKISPVAHLVDENGAAAGVQMFNNQLLLSNRLSENDQANSRFLSINNANNQADPAYALGFGDIKNGVATYHTILHSGNLHLFGLGAVPASVE